MAIDKESTGIPEVDFGRRTTKVNLGIVVGAALFLVIMFSVVIHFVRRDTAEKKVAPPPAQNAPASRSGSAGEPAKQ